MSHGPQLIRILKRKAKMQVLVWSKSYILCEECFIVKAKRPYTVISKSGDNSLLCKSIKKLPKIEGANEVDDSRMRTLILEGFY